MALSSAILYLAIVAIWAVVLVPRWLRPAQTDDDDLSGDEDEVLEAEEFADSAEDVRGPAQIGEEHAAAPREAARSAADPHGHGRRPVPRRSAVASGTRHAPSYPRRARIMQARRRTLATLVLLTAGAIGLTAAHLAAWWVTIPPALMLAGFVMLLRTAARIDVQRARAAHERWEPGQVEPREVSGRSEHRTAEEVAPAPAAHHPGSEAPGLSAEIIDISARMEDQPYDQYLDAEARAVGD